MSTTSEKQLAANRANSQKSTGPKNTTKTRYNGIRHGLTASHVILPWENEADFEAIKSAMMSRFRPIDDWERLLVKNAAETYWTLERSKRVETNMFYVLANQEAQDSPGPADNLHVGNVEAICFFKAGNHTDRIRRYDAHHQRMYEKAIAQVEKMASLRRPDAIYEPPTESKHEYVEEPPESSIVVASIQLPLEKEPLRVLGDLLEDPEKAA